MRTSSCCYSFSLLFLPSMTMAPYHTYQLTSKRRFGINFRRACSIFCRFIAVKFRQYSQRLTTKRGFASGSLNFDVASKVQAIVSRMRTRFLCALATNLATIHSQLLAHCSSKYIWDVFRRTHRLSGRKKCKIPFARPKYAQKSWAFFSLISYYFPSALVRNAGMKAFEVTS